MKQYFRNSRFFGRSVKDIPPSETTQVTGGTLEDKSTVIEPVK
jgi:hypothetical protein